MPNGRFVSFALFMSFSAMVGNAALAQHFQSPINIDTARAKGNKNQHVALHAMHHTDLTLINTGSPDTEATIRAIVPEGSAKLVIGGEPYMLKQFHFHAKSEHTINGVQYPMEMHSVFQTATGKTAVIGRLIAIGKNDGKLMPLFNSLPQSKDSQGILAGFELAHLYPANLAYYRYEGSLTTPPFTEGVHWFVLKQPLYLSEEEITKFTALFPKGDNRELQSLDGRAVFYSNTMTFHRIKI